MSAQKIQEAGDIPAGLGKQAFDRSEASYLFAAVRQDLPPAIQGVQLCHATATAAAAGGLREDTRFVIVSVKDQEQLLELARQLDHDGVAFSMFEEPDYGIGYSALATHVAGVKTGKRFSRMPLWSIASDRIM